MLTKSKLLHHTELFDINSLKTIIRESSKFYVVDSNDFNRASNQNWYAERVIYQGHYYSATDLIICELDNEQYIVTPKLFRQLGSGSERLTYVRIKEIIN
jgi:hypothetical protein